MNDRELPEFIAERLPYDGPHSPETVLAATESVSALVRYLNNATRSADALPYASTVDTLVSYLETATGGLDQLLQQLASALARHAEQPGLYDDRRQGFEPTATANAAADRLESARAQAQDLADQLTAARHLTTHLGNDI